MNIDFIRFNQRAERSRYIARRFGDYLQGSVLDVGCDRAVLRELLGGDVQYTGIDVGGTPDLVLDLERVDRLPFADNSFSAVVCSDVLEHLDNIHHVFRELVRVGSRFIIISLPNNWANARLPIERGRGSIAHYGLPSVRPADRHKWFFGYSEAVEFLRGQERLSPVKIVYMIANEKPRWQALRLIRRLRYPQQERYLNRYAHTVWAVFEKRTNGA